MVAIARRPTAEKAEMEIALERTSQVAVSRMLLLVFWGLILAKCSLLQWAILNYDVPVDGGLFIWLPSFLFGAVCSFVYGKVTLEEFHRTPLTSRLVRGIWAACIAAMALFGVVAVGLGGMSPFLLPAIFAVLMGVGFFIQAMIDPRPYLRAAAVGWWLGSIWLFYEASISALLSLSILIITMQVIPTTLLFWQEKQALKRSNRN
ncbi:hypothetical protein [Cerasicoccus arenae]|uniref:Uncharacterized protein n=1 Tax=Cerasicoccus arenae TaxID=424488 RepID=A0A8J3DB39_9BACT|nr:hypothetical protein [Cerasicoccus arenae]MBK1856802.1 hypothetical protein [Cerasicoccus arenae]GHB99601.1 hypothetical protein GCM10007047_14850 [Cerasicoccus arenae]